MEDGQFRGDDFYEAVEKAFEPVEKQLFGRDGHAAALREKRRVHEKIRKAGQAIAPQEGRVRASVDEMATKLVNRAFSRLDMAGSRLIHCIDWTLILSSFIAEAWPELGSRSRVSAVVEKAVRQWRDQSGRSAPLHAWPDAQMGLAPGVDRRKPAPEVLPVPRALTSALPRAEPAEGKQQAAEASAPDSQAAGDREQGAPEPAADRGARVRGGREGVCSSSPSPAKCAEEGLVEAAADEGRTAREVVIPRFLEGAPLGAFLAGLNVSSVRPQSLADGQLLPGDCISMVNRRRVESQEQLLEELARARPGPLRLTVLRRRGCASEAAEASAAARAPSPPVDVVVNGEDVGREASGCSPAFAGQDFSWEAVVRVVEHYGQQGFHVQCVCTQETQRRHPPPDHIVPKLLTCPVVDKGSVGPARRIDRVFTLRLAETYGCPWVDNANYRARDWEGFCSWGWLQCAGMALKIGYIFDAYGKFVASRSLPGEGRSDR